MVVSLATDPAIRAGMVVSLATDPAIRARMVASTSDRACQSRHRRRSKLWMRDVRQPSELNLRIFRVEIRLIKGHVGCIHLDGRLHQIGRATCRERV